MSRAANPPIGSALLRMSLRRCFHPMPKLIESQPGLPSPPFAVAHGLTATGKSSIVRKYLELSEHPHAIINSRECITGRHLLERTTTSVLDALDEYDGGSLDRRPYSRTDSLSVLVVHLQKMLEGRRNKLVLVFDGIDRQREAPPTLLPALARFGESVRLHTLYCSPTILQAKS